MPRAMIIVSSAALLLAPVHAQAWRVLDTCDAGWASSPVVMKFITADLPVGNNLRGAAEAQLSEWNSIPGSNSIFVAQNDDENFVSMSNNENEVYLSSSLPGNFIGQTQFRCLSGGFYNPLRRIVEADVLFRRTPIPGWSTAQPVSAQQLGDGSATFFHPTASHEFGHALALGHENGVTAVMNSVHPFHGFTGDSRDRRWFIGADDRVGKRNLYGSGGSVKDIAPTSVRALTDGSGQANPHAVFPETVSRGSQIGVDTGHENMGTVTLTFEVAVYLSTDRIITTSDYYLGSHFPQNVPPGQVATFGFQYTVPLSVPPGQYYVGFIVDPSNQHAEQWEGSNNATDLIRITVQ